MVGEPAGIVQSHRNFGIVVVGKNGLHQLVREELTASSIDIGEIFDGEHRANGIDQVWQLDGIAVYIVDHNGEVVERWLFGKLTSDGIIVQIEVEIIGEIFARNGGNVIPGNLVAV